MEPDVLLPAQRVYALAVRDAATKYNQAVAAARKIRDEEIAEALAICLEVMSVPHD